MAAPMRVSFSVDAGWIEWPYAPTADPCDHHLVLDVMVDACPHRLGRGCQVASGRSRQAGLTVWNEPHSSWGMTAPRRFACRPTTKCRSEADDGHRLAAYRRWHTNKAPQDGAPMKERS
jgi:hypothetical protein